MKLYTKPGTCSTAVHISLQWVGAPFELAVLNPRSMKAPDYLAINPSGAVPAIVDGDFVLTQNAAIQGYLADLHPQAGLAGDGSPRQRAEANQWLAFCNSDVHPAFHPLFMAGRFLKDSAQHDALKAAARVRLRDLYERAERQLDGRQWIAGFRSYADPYLYITLRWARATGVDLSGFGNLARHTEQMEADPGVQSALKAEGLG